MKVLRGPGSICAAFALASLVFLVCPRRELPGRIVPAGIGRSLGEDGSEGDGFRGDHDDGEADREIGAPVAGKFPKAGTSGHGCDPTPGVAEWNAEKLYESAKKKFSDSEFQAALDDLQRARELDPGSVKIRDLYNEISRVLNRKPSEWSDDVRWVSTSGPTRIVRTRDEIEAFMAEGDREHASGHYASALKAYEAAVQKLKWTPYDIGMNDTLELAKSRVADERRFVEANPEAE